MVRPAGLPSVLCNVGAGALLATGAVNSRTLWACLASVLLYAGGMILNDAADAAEDAVQRPDRPIPSGEMTRRTAFLTGLLVLVLAQVAVIPCGEGARLMAAVMAGLIMFYDLLPVFRWGSGPLCLAAIRGCNVLLGATAASGAVEVFASWADVPAAPYAVYVMAPYVLALSLVAAGETGPARPWHPAVLAAAGPPVGTMLFLVLTDPGRGPGHLAAAGACVVLLVIVGRAVRIVGSRPQAAVGSLLGGICLLDTAAAGIGGGPVWAAAGGIAWLVSRAVGRRYSPT